VAIAAVAASDDEAFAASVGAWTTSAPSDTFTPNTITLRVDAGRDGTYETTLSATSAFSATGLAGVMTHTFGPGHSSVDDFCWGP
jgi:hypothetical protein